MSIKYDLPDLYVSEYGKFDEIKRLGNLRSTTGNITFTSSSSGTTYNSTTGQLGIMQQLETILQNYKINASDWNTVTEHLADNAKSITTNGASVSNPNNLEEIETAISERKDILVPTGEYVITDGLTVSTPVTIHGMKDGSIKNTNAASSGDMSIESNDVTLENVKIEGLSTTQGIYTGVSNVKRFKIKAAKIISAKHALNFNTQGLEDIDILNSDIHAESYGVLTNANAINSKNMNIAFNKIYSRLTDAVELNNPTEIETDVFKQVKIIANTLTAHTDGTSPSAGFAIGIANTHDVAVIANMIEKSRLEAYHIEDNQENIVAMANIFNGCVSDGMRLYPKGKPTIASNNHIIKDGLVKTGNGIYRVYNVDGSIDSILQGNIIRGFNIGLWLDGKSTVNVDGTIIEDCNIAIEAGTHQNIIGKIVSMNCPTLVRAGTGCIIDGVVSKIPPTTILQYTGTAGNAGATLKSFSALTNQIVTTSGVTNTIDLFALPSLMSGKLIIRVPGTAAKIYSVCDVLWDGTTLTISNQVKSTGGTFGSSVTVKNNGGNLAFDIFSASANTITVYYDFEGVYYKQ